MVATYVWAVAPPMVLPFSVHWYEVPPLPASSVALVWAQATTVVGGKFSGSVGGMVIVTASEQANEPSETVAV